MNIGTQTNSVVNHLYSRMTIGAPAPVVGMGATKLSWTDRHAATVTKVTKLKSKVWAYEIFVIEDKPTVVSGSVHDGSAVYTFEPNPSGYADMYRMDSKTGKWVRGYINQQTGRFKQRRSGGLILGMRDHHFDPHF
jgi:hypothetical protein